MTMTNANRRGRQFTPERLQQIRNLVERGKSREEIAELIGVTVGSLQDTCSRLGIGLTYTGSRGGDVPLPPINGQSQQNSQSGPVEQPQATTPHEERARTDEMGLANLALRMKYRGERTRMIPIDRKSPVDTHIESWLFAGSDRGGERAAVMYTLIQTAKLNDIDPQAWLADVLARINDHNIQKLDQLLPWNWKTTSAKLAA